MIRIQFFFHKTLHSVFLHSACMYLCTDERASNLGIRRKLCLNVYAYRARNLSFRSKLHLNVYAFITRFECVCLQSQKAELQKETDLLQEGVEKLQCELIETTSIHAEDLKQKDSERETMTALKEDLQVCSNGQWPYCMLLSKAEMITRTSPLVRVVSPCRPQFLKVN